MNIIESSSLNRELNRSIYLRGSAFQGNMPLYIQISLLESCNLHCDMCYRSNLPPHLNRLLSRENMPLDLYRRLAEDAFPYAERITFGWAGEPTLHPELDKILEIAYGYGVETTLWTNGTLLNQPMISEAAARFADWLVVSIDGSNEETFSQARSGSSLQAIEKNVEDVRALSLRMNRKYPLRLRAHMTLRRSAIQHLPGVIKKAHALGMERISAAHIGIFNGKMEKESLFHAKEEADGFLRAASDCARELGLSTDFPPLFCESAYGCPVHNFYCSLANYMIIVLCNGDVLPCCHGDSRFGLVMGNLNQNRLPDIWHGRRYALLRDSFAAQEYAPACRDCVNNNPFMNIQGDWDIDEYSEWAKTYNGSFRDFRILDELEKRIVSSQRQIAQTVWEEEKKLDRQFERIALLEAMVGKKFRHGSSFREQRKDRIEQFPMPALHRSNNGWKRELNRALYEKGVEFQGNRPLRLELSLMAGCNIHCVMCNLARRSPEERRALLQQRMDWELYQRMAEEAFPYAESIFFGVGGEPTLHPQFGSFVRLAKEAGLRVEMTTNGLLLEKEEICETCVECVDRCVLSIDGARKKTFEKIRRGASWNQLMNGIRKITQRRSAASHSPLRLILNFTLMKDTIDEFPDAVTLASLLGIDKVTAEHVILTSPELAEQSLFSMPEHSDRRVLEALERAKILGVAVEAPDLFEMSLAPDYAPPGTIRNIRPQQKENDAPHCKLLDYAVAIMPDGNVQPCSHPDAQHLFVMGNLNERSLSEIWFGSKFQQLREGSGELPAPCSNCSMSGRSDGGAPMREWDSPLPAALDAKELHPKRYHPRRMIFLSQLQRQEESILHHGENIKELLSRMMLHEQNLKEIIERKRTRWRRWWSRLWSR
ncbi:MAG: radical SAM protein [Candidatus Omnitrophota bacterium]